MAIQINESDKVVSIEIIKKGDKGDTGDVQEIADAINNAEAIVSIDGSEKVGVTLSGLLRSVSLTTVKNWVSSTLSVAWNSLTGTSNHIPLTTSPTSVPTTEGTLSWNPDDHTLNLQTEIAAVMIQVGQELLVPIRNNTGEILTDGTVVAITGSTGTRVTVEKAIASNATHAKSVIGLITSDVAINGDGYCTIFGRTRNLDTSGFNEGEALYLSTVTAGTMVNSEPSAPNYRVRIGWVEKKSAGNGVILVHSERFSCQTSDIVDLSSWAGSSSITTAGALNATSYSIGGILVINTDGSVNFANFTSDSSGNVNAVTLTASSNVTAGASSAFILNGRSKIRSTTDGNIVLSNNAASSFGILQLGGTSSSFPGIRRNGTVTEICRADGSAFSNLKAADVTSTTGFNIVNGSYTSAISSATLTDNRTFSLVDRNGTVAILPSDLYDSTRHNVLTGTTAQARAELGSGAVGDSIFQAATVAAVETAIGSYFPVTKVASADVSKTSDTTYDNDTDIVFTGLVANARYKLDFWIYIVCDAGGFKAQFTMPIDATAGSQFGQHATFDGALVLLTSGSGTNIVLSQRASTTSGRTCAGTITFVAGASGGTLALQWAQNSSSAVASTRKAGSFATLTRLP